jgi:transcriptional regulator with XRE-family HTH domain
MVDRTSPAARHHALLVGLNLRDHRRDAGLSQYDLAEALGVERQRVSRWERGVNIPGAGQQDQIAELLGIHWTDLFRRRDEHA